tara:strand:+ start:295 stop:459 length:165 start_codon:yes stop_codon:yes gene_type:complete
MSAGYRSIENWLKLGAIMQGDISAVTAVDHVTTEGKENFPNKVSSLIEKKHGIL